MQEVAKRSHSFQLEHSAAKCSRAVREVTTESPWELIGSGQDHVAIREDATRLCCTISPVSAEIWVIEEGPSRVRIRLDGSVPGWGIIASRQLSDRLRMLERVIREHAGNQPKVKA